MEKFYVATNNIIDGTGCYLKKGQQITENEATMLFRSKLDNLLDKKLLIPDYVEKNKFYYASDGRQVPAPLMSYGTFTYELQPHPNSNEIIGSKEWGSVSLGIRSAFSLLHGIILTTGVGGKQECLSCEGFIDSTVRDKWTVSVFNHNSLPIKFDNVQNRKIINGVIHLPVDMYLTKANIVDIPLKNNEEVSIGDILKINYCNIEN